VSPTVNGGDRAQRFVFEGSPVRGGLVSLDAAWREIVARRAYPGPLRALLGELTAASALLASTLKFDGALVLQIQGRGPLRLLVVECQSDLALRASARFDEDAPLPAEATLRTLSGDGRCAITLDLGDGRPSYQGVVPLDGHSASEVLEGYMSRSEQLDTRLVLAADEHRAAGLLLQRLPSQGGRAPAPSDEDAWAEARALAGTLRPAELLAHPGDVILRRVFGGHDLRVFESLPLVFRCRCTRDKVARLLRLMGADDVHALLAERGTVDVTCDFCHLGYTFAPEEAEAALRATVGPERAEPIG
jgi:molecular chaperone Hsp33